MENNVDNLITVFQDYKTTLKCDKSHYDNLITLKEIVGAQNCILENNGDFTFSKYVGFISKGKTRLQVLPKLYAVSGESSTSIEVRESLLFMFRLLGWSGYLNHKLIEKALISSDEGNLLEIIIQIFIKRFLELHYKNVHREYVGYEDDQIYIKGKIIFPESFKTRLRKHSHLRVKYDDFSMNNPINRILKTTMRNLIFASNNSENKKYLRQGLFCLEEVEYIPLTEQIFGTMVNNRANADYQPLINLAKMLSIRRRPGLRSGDSETLTFLIPLNLLFEKFVLNILEESTKKNDTVIYHSHKYLAIDSKGRKTFRLEPDFVIKDKLHSPIILDTKYANPYGSDGQMSIGAHDLYQICTYAMCYNSVDVALIYPRFKGQEKRPLIEKYTIPTIKDSINLSIIQIDIFEENKETICSELEKIIYKEILDNKNSAFNNDIIRLSDINISKPGVIV